MTTAIQKPNQFAPGAPFAPSRTSDLIADWAARVMVLWQQSRRPAAPSAPGSQDGDDFTEAFLVRDQLDNRLLCAAPGVAECPAGSLRMLHSADALLLQFTTEEGAIKTQVTRSHYPRQSQWWWRRLERSRAGVPASGYLTT